MELIDKDSLPEGPWMEEPDYKRWVEGDCMCLIVRRRWGALTGYVGVPLDHPLAKVDWLMLYNDNFEKLHGKEVVEMIRHINEAAHYGITFTDEAIAVPPEDKENVKGYFFIGFDCMHGGDDLIPGLDETLKKCGSHPMGGVYRDWNYVTDHVRAMAHVINSGGRNDCA